MHEDEQQLAIGGVTTRRAGCRWISFLPIRASGGLIVTNERILFRPILHFALVARQMELGLDEVQAAAATGNTVSLNLTELMAFGKSLVITLKNGKKLTFRSMQADQLADAINYVILRREGREGTEG